MDILKASMYLFFLMLSVNAVSSILPYAGIVPPLNYTMTTDDYADALVEGWAGGDEPFYDIGTGLISFWLIAVPVVESFPQMLATFGAPVWIYVPLHGIWRLMWLTAVALGIIAGRQT